MILREIKTKQKSISSQNDQFLDNYDEIEKWLFKHGIDQFFIYPNTSEVDVYGNADLQHTNLINIPIKFRHVTGDFNCSGNKLISLLGSPNIVDGSYLCTHNKLTSVQGAPRHVGDDCWFSYNKLSSLQGSPLHVGGSFLCGYNQLTSLQYAPKEIGKMLDCSTNNLNTLEGAPSHISYTLMCDGDAKTLNNITKFIKSTPRMALMHVDHTLCWFMWVFRIKSLQRIELYDASAEQDKVAEIINKHLKGDRSGPACQIELIDAGLGKYIKL